MTYYQAKIPALDLDPSKIKPLRNRVLIRIADRVEKVGSIVVPHIARDLPNEGMVIAIGADVTGCKVGERVAFEKHAHADREYMIFPEPEGREGRYLIVKFEQVWAVL